MVCILDGSVLDNLGRAEIELYLVLTLRVSDDLVILVSDGFVMLVSNALVVLGVLV